MTRKLTTLVLMVLLAAAAPAAADLTGEWTDDNGACYRIRQVDQRVYWQMDGGPRVVNVFSGLLVGDVLNGRWADLPGYRLLGSGTLSLRVESDARMTRIAAGPGQAYGGSVWTRRRCAAPVIAPPEPPPGPTPASGCEAAIEAGLSCAASEAGKEAGFGSTVQLVCPPATVISVVAGSYGANCPNVPRGNVTSYLQKQCDGKRTCDYKVEYGAIGGDPAGGCVKSYVAEFRCVPGFAVDSVAGINVVAATYGGNCGQPRGNVTDHLRSSCQGQARCDYRVDHTVIGDPARGCPKDYVAEWRCGPSGAVRSTYAEPEAGFGSTVELRCP